MAPLEQVMGIEPTFSAWKADVLSIVRHLQRMVQVGGLEPPRYEPQEPKSCVSANSTIPAC